MRRSVALLAVCLLVGCRQVDEKLLTDTLLEIANIGSQAKCPGPRSPAQIDRTTAQVTSCSENVKRLAR